MNLVQTIMSLFAAAFFVGLFVTVACTALLVKIKCFRFGKGARRAMRCVCAIGVLCGAVGVAIPIGTCAAVWAEQNIPPKDFTDTGVWVTEWFDGGFVAGGVEYVRLPESVSVNPTVFEENSEPAICYKQVYGFLVDTRWLHYNRFVYGEQFDLVGGGEALYCPRSQYEDFLAMTQTLSYEGTYGTCYRMADDPTNPQYGSYYRFGTEMERDPMLFQRPTDPRRELIPSAAVPFELIYVCKSDYYGLLFGETFCYYVDGGDVFCLNTEESEHRPRAACRYSEQDGESLIELFREYGLLGEEV